MARLLKGDKMGDPPRGRRLSFKTKGEKRTSTVRAVRVTVASSSVAVIASKFNAVVVEDESKGRALLKKKTSNGTSGSVKEAVKKFEGLQGSTTVLVRKNSMKQQVIERRVEKVEIPEKVEEQAERPEQVKDTPKPSVHPKPKTLDRKHQSRYVKKEHKELLVKDKRLSLPRTLILDEFFNEKEETVDHKKETAEPKPEKPSQVNITANPSSLHGTRPKSALETELSSPVLERPTSLNLDISSTRILPSRLTETSNVTPQNNEEIYGNHEVIKSVEELNKKNERLTNCNIDSPTNNIRPNSSFLWGVKVSDVVPVSQNGFNNVKESPIDDLTDNKVTAKEDVIENKENLEKLETPIVRTVDKKGYGKINVQANSSSLYRNILKQALLGEIKEKLGSMDKLDEKPELEESKKTELIITKTLLNEDTKTYGGSERGYEVIDQSYEVISFSENSYAEIEGPTTGRREAYYDDSSSLHSEQIYETIDGGNRHHQTQQHDSDSSCDLQSNSLYEHRPPSQASSGGSGSGGGASRSDTSDDWVDIELDSSNEDQKEQIVLLQTTPREPKVGWSVKVRRQWSTRSSANRALYPTDDSDSSSKHYELVDNVDEDSALCDDFDDSSDSECSENNTYKPNVEERLQPEVNQTDTIYSLMKEAGKRMRKTSSTIGKSLRRISRISKTPSAQDIFNGGNGLNRGKWPSFKKKTPQATSTFYLNEANLQKSQTPPPRPPPPAIAPDPRRLSVSIRPTSPPPPPPPHHINGESKKKAINNPSLYTECGLFPGLERRNNSSSWYSDVGLYENSKPFSDTASEHGSSQGSDIDLRFADEPLYQFYTERVAKEELSEELGETGYEEIGENRSLPPRPSALDLVSPEMQRTLWCQVPQVIESGILETLTPERKKLQEAKFEVVTSEASYYKSLTILEKHFSASQLLKDENVLPKVHYKTLFGNVSAIRKCSEAVLAALEKCWQESILLEGLSEVISDVAEKHFSVYKKYCTNQLAIERTLKTLKKTNQAFVDALEVLQKSPKCHNLAFYSFILLPMQRITRMPLLQDAILTKLTPNDPEYEACQLALAKLNKIVYECNEAARQSERMEEMMLLSRAIDFPPDVKSIPLLSASRWLVRSGDMTHVILDAKTTFSRKLAVPKNSKLKLFLFSDYLVITKKKGEDHFLVVTYCQRNLVQMSDVEEAIPNRFLIMLTLLKNHEGKTQEMVLCCGGESSRARWISALSPPAPSNPGERLYEDWDCPQVCAIHAYVASQPDELTLQNGDVINVLRKTADGWYYGERTRDTEQGWFPGNHTKEILSSHVRARNLKQRYRLLALSSNFIQSKQQVMGKAT